MPPPVLVYVAVALGTVAAGIAFKEFIYEPHIAPKIERWAEDFVARRQERRRQREASRQPVAVPQEEEEPRGRGDGPDGSSVELDNLGFHEMREDLGASHAQAYLRRRQTRNPRLMDESDPHIAFDPLSPEVAIHVIYDADSSLSTSPAGSLRVTPSTARMPLRPEPEFRSPRPAALTSPARSLSLASAAGVGPLGGTFSPLSHNADSPSFSYPTSPFSDAAAIQPPSPSHARSNTGSISGHTLYASAQSEFDFASSERLAWNERATSPSAFRVASPLAQAPSANAPSRAASVASPFSLRDSDSDEDFDLGSVSGLSDDESWASASVAGSRR